MIINLDFLKQYLELIATHILKMIYIKSRSYIFLQSYVERKQKIMSQNAVIQTPEACEVVLKCFKIMSDEVAEHFLQMAIDLARRCAEESQMPFDDISVEPAAPKPRPKFYVVG